MSFQVTALLLTWVALAVLALAMSGLVRQIHVLSGRRTSSQYGPTPGTPVADFGGLPSRDGKPLLLLFASDHCESCSQLLPLLRDLSSREQWFHAAALFAESAPIPMVDGLTVIENQRDVFDRLGVAAVPFGVWCDPQRRIASSTPLGSEEALHEFVHSARERMPAG